MEKKSERRPIAGDVYAMRFKNGNWGCFVVAHVIRPRGYMDMVVYGMDVKERTIDEIRQVSQSLTRKRAVTWERIGARAVFDGTFQYVGQVDKYSREAWPVPPQDGRGVPRHVVYVGYKDPKNRRMTKAQVLPDHIQINFHYSATNTDWGICPKVEELLQKGIREFDLGGDWLDEWVKYIPILDKQRCVPGF